MDSLFDTNELVELKLSIQKNEGVFMPHVGCASDEESLNIILSAKPSDDRSTYSQSVII